MGKLYSGNSVAASSVVLYFLFFLLQDASPGFVDPGAVFVEGFEGWGSSLAWFGDVLGGMPQNVQDEITEAFFSADKLNLNILRYTIGGTTPDNYVCGPYRAGGATESFWDGPDFPYNWSRDPRARKVLLAAKQYGVDTFEAFSNSPPQWMTISGCSKGNDEGGSLHKNFDHENGNADLFADYLTEVVKYYHENYNVTFQYLAPFNEPSSAYWGGSTSSQEGCNMDRVGMAAVIRSLDTSLKQKSMDYTKISVADETNIDVEIETQAYFRDQGIGSLFSKINSHGYSGSRRDLLYSVSQRDGHVLWMDEMGWGASPANDMTQGLYLANRIVLDMRTMLPSAWVYWQVLEDQVSGAWGLIDVPYEDPTVDNIQYNSGYFAMLQFSKYIRKGYTFIQVSDINCVAAFDQSSSTLVLVIVNGDEEDSENSYDLNLFASLGTIRATRTSSTEQNADISPPEISEAKLVSYTAPPQSVTTLSISGSTVSESTKTNLVENGDFEVGNGDPSPWTLFFGENGGANQDYLRRGRFSGFIRTTDSDLSLNQDIIAPQTKTYYLTAWCATSGPGTKFGVQINNIQGPEVGVSQSEGYRSYGISFSAAAGDKISLYLYAPHDASESFIDDVTLH